MDRVDKEGYSKELVENWVKERNLKQELENESRRETLESDISEAQMRVVWRLIATIATILVPIFFIWLRFSFR